MTANPSPSRSTSKNKTTIGYTVTSTWCRACAPEGVTLGGNEVYDEDQFGIYDHCDNCGEQLAPCEHAWDEWRPAYQPTPESPAEIRFCTQPDCGEADYR